MRISREGEEDRKIGRREKRREARCERESDFIINFSFQLMGIA